MNPVPISDEAAHSWPGFRRIVVAGPNGDLSNDGSSPEKAVALEVLHGQFNNWPLFVERWVPTPDDLEKLEEGGELELCMYTPQLIVHSLGVRDPSGTGQARRRRLNRAEFQRRSEGLLEEICDRAADQGLYGDRGDIKKLVSVVHEVEMERLYNFIFEQDEDDGEERGS